MLPGGRLEPLRSSTYGLGLVVADAIRRGATTIVLGLGGSASSDGGAGMAQALGARLLDANGHELPPEGGALADLVHLDLAPLAPRSTASRSLSLVMSTIRCSVRAERPWCSGHRRALGRIK